MYKHYGLFIDGSWHDSYDGSTMKVMSPVTEQPIGDCPTASAIDTARAIEAANAGLNTWSKTPAFVRSDTLHRIADEMIRRSEEAALMISMETGKPLAQSGREWVLASDQFRWFAEEARRIYGRLIESRVPGGRFEVHREPVGVVAAFTAWNFPAALIARKVAPALAAGCSVIVRPSSQTPGTGMILFDCLRAANLPAGTANLVIGSTDNTYTPLMQAKSVRKVSLTGSTRVGQQMIRDAAQTVKKVSMELGGNAPLIVFDDADIDAAIELAVPTKYANCGQVCVTADRFFLHERVHDEFIEKFVRRAASLKLGDGIDPEVDMGPLISAKALHAASEVIDEAVSAGATLALGGGRPAQFNSGHFLEPTVLTDVRDDMRVFAEENFAPIAAMTRFSSDDEVIERANASDMGLSAYSFTTSQARVQRIVRELKAGMVGINSFAMAASEAPFGGTNYSGMGREGGVEGIEGYLDTKLAQIVVGG